MSAAWTRNSRKVSADGDGGDCCLFLRSGGRCASAVGDAFAFAGTTAAALAGVPRLRARRGARFTGDGGGGQRGRPRVAGDGASFARAPSEPVRLTSVVSMTDLAASRPYLGEERRGEGGGGGQSCKSSDLRRS